MFADDLAELYGVDDETHKAVLCIPHAVMLVAGFVAVAHAVLVLHGVTADIENRGQRLLDDFWPVKIRRDVKTGLRLIVEVLDDDAVLLELAGLRRLQIRARRQWI